MWMLYHGRLLTNLRKHKMGIGNPMCRFCLDEIESKIHVLRDCLNQWHFGCVQWTLLQEQVF